MTKGLNDADYLREITRRLIDGHVAVDARAALALVKKETTT